MKIIKKESLTFLDESYLIQFENLTLPIPQWWSQTKFDSHLIRFERTDTSYDWFATYQWIEGAEAEKLESLLEKKLNEEKINFEELETHLETDSRVLIKDHSTAHHFQECIRVEGVATQNEIERIYYDLVLLRGLDTKGYFIFESKSSVLNGSLEVPFFEECLKELKLHPN